MFRTKFKLITKDWQEIHTFKGRIKPIEGEYFFVDKFDSYFEVIKVVHVLNKKHGILLIVKKISNILEKPLQLG